MQQFVKSLKKRRTIRKLLKDDVFVTKMTDREKNMA